MAAKVKEEQKRKSSKSILKAFMDEHEDAHYNRIKPNETIISSGSLGLDSLITVRSGSFVRLGGKGSQLGKTSQCLVFAENYMKVMPNSKTIFFKAEARLTPEIQAASGLKFVTDEDEWDTGTVFVMAANEFEITASCLETIIPEMHELGEHLCVIIDSLDGLILRDDKRKDLWNGTENVKVAGVPALTKILFRRLALSVVHFDVLMLITGQYTADIKLDPYSKAPPRQTDGSGGSAINHQSDITLSYQPRFGSDYIYEKPKEKPDPIKNKRLGVYATVEIKKSSTNTTGERVRIPIKDGRKGCAIWVEKEIVDIMVGFEMITRNGAWYSFSEAIIAEAKHDGLEIKPQFQGMEPLYKYVEEEKPVFDWLFKKVKDLIYAFN